MFLLFFFGFRDCCAVHKKSWTVSIQTDLFFHKTYSMPSTADDLYQYVERTFPDHDINLVY